MINKEKKRKLLEAKKQLEEGKNQVNEAMKEYRLIQKDSMINCLRIMEENGFFSEDGLKLLNTRTSKLGGFSPHERLKDFRESCENAISEIDQLYPDQEMDTYEQN